MEKVIEKILADCKDKKLRIYDKGECLFTENEKAKHIYIKVTGEVEITKTLGTTKTFTRVIPEFSLLGVNGLISNGNYLYSARATSRIHAYEINHKEFLSVLEKNPSIKFEVMKILSSEVNRLESFLTTGY